MTDYLDELGRKKQEQAESKFKQDSLASFDNLATQVSTLLDSLDKTGVKRLDKEYIKAVKSLEKVLSAIKEVRVTADQDIKDAITGLAYVLANLDIKPTVNVPAPRVEVNERTIDFKPLIDAVKKLDTKTEVNVDVQAIVKSVESVKSTLKSLRFPASNFILPFKNSQGAASQVQLDSNGNVPITGTITVDTTGLATSAKQDEQTTHLAAIETAVELLDNTVSGNELQVDVVAALPAGDNNIGNVDVVAMPTVTVQATNLDIRDLSSASDSVTIVPSGTQTVSGTVTANAGTGTFTTKETRSGTGTVTSVNDTASSTTLLASNANRLGASILNDSTSTLYIKTGTTASATDYTVKLYQDDYWEVPFGYTGRIDGIWSSDASGAARITEYT